MKNIVITGASRGIGKALALEFLKSGSSVYITGRHKETLLETARTISVESKNNNIEGVVCDVTRPEELEKLWIRATYKQPVDIWINNAGINHPRHHFHDLDPLQVSNVIDTNIKGTVFGSKVAIEGMLKQGFGMIYNMEGFGSKGRLLQGMSIYGTSKSAVRYFTKSLIKEYRDTCVGIGSISPGMVVTEMLLEPLREEPDRNRDARKIFNILADPADRVSPWLVRKILGHGKHGVHFAWLTSGKITCRFMMNLFMRRKVKGLPELP